MPLSDVLLHLSLTYYLFKATLGAGQPTSGAAEQTTASAQVLKESLNPNREFHSSFSRVERMLVN